MTLHCRCCDAKFNTFMEMLDHLKARRAEKRTALEKELVAKHQLSDEILHLFREPDDSDIMIDEEFDEQEQQVMEDAATEAKSSEEKQNGDNAVVAIKPTPTRSLSFVANVSGLIDDFMYVGNIFIAGSEDWLKENGVGYVLDVCREPEEAAAHVGELYSSLKIKSLHLPIEDAPQFDIQAFFPQALKFIDEAKEAKSRVLVHCMAGVSRSATVATASMVQRGRTLAEALVHLRNKRSVVYPNAGFFMQLLTFELVVHGKLSIPQDALQLHSENIMDIWKSLALDSADDMDAFELFEDQNVSSVMDDEEEDAEEGEPNNSTD